MTPEALLAGSSLYRERRAEHAEILRYQLVRNALSGQDIGFDAALVGWMIHHRKVWRQSRNFYRAQTAGLTPVDAGQLACACA